MSNFQVFFTQPAVVHLGWTLLHFLWQGTLVAVLFAVVRGLTSRWMTAHARYVLACFSLAVMAFVPILTYGLLASDSWRSAAQIAPIPPSRMDWSGSVAPAGGLDNLQRALPWLELVWFTGVVVLLIRLVRGTLFAEHLRTKGVCAAPDSLNQAFHRIAQQMGVGRRVRLMISSIVEVPVVIGWFRPLVLMPVAALTGLAPQQIEALLAHELAHILRHDYLVNVLQGVVEAVLFYHPAVWWMSNQLRKERELCCDDLAVAASGDALGYAHALADLESSRPAHAHTAIAANGGSLLSRIRRLAERQPVSHTALGTLAAISVTLIVLAVVGGVVVKGAQRSSASVGVVQRSEIWVDTVKRGDLTVEVRGLGTLTTNTTAELRIPMPVMKEVQVGQNVSIQFADRRDVVSGKVTAISAGVTDGTRSVAVAMSGALPAGVQQGAAVDGIIEIGRLKNVIIVGRPVEGQANSSGTLFKLEPNGEEAVRVKVEFGRPSVNTIQIRSGLEPGDKVILSDMSPFKAYDRATLK